MLDSVLDGTEASARSGRLGLVARYRHAQLLVVLTLLVLVGPFVDHVTLGLAIMDILLVVTLASSVVACSRNRVQLALGLALALLVQVDLFRLFSGRQEGLDAGYLLLLLVFFAYVTVLVAADVFRGSERVSADSICGALSAYLLLGVTWACAYALFETLVPGSFTGPLASADASLERFLGYSFVTLTTLGYGNVVPIDDRGEALASMEAIVGQVYLTVLVARLVALNLRPPPPAPSDPS